MNSPIKKIKEKIKRLSNSLHSPKKASSFNPKGRLTAEEVSAFEGLYQIELPPDFQTFMSEVGYGGKGPNGEIVKPGVYLNQLFDEPLSALSRVAQVSPDREIWENWEKLIDSVENTNDAHDFIYGGLLPLSCNDSNYYDALILNGPWRGRVVYFNVDLDHPQFYYEACFLDWYERWLDDQQHGHMICPKVRGGTPTELITAFKESQSFEDRLEILHGFDKFRQINLEAVHFLKGLCRTDQVEIRHKALHLLARLNKDEAKVYIKEHLERKNGLLAALMAIPTEDASDWVDPLVLQLYRIKREDTFRHVCRLFKACNRVDLLVPLCESSNPRFRYLALETLRDLPGLEPYAQVLAKHLFAENSGVVRSCIGCLNGLKDERLLPYYEKLLEADPKPKDLTLKLLMDAIEALGPIAKPVLEKAAFHPAEVVQRKARAALGLIKK